MVRILARILYLKAARIPVALAAAVAAGSLWTADAAAQAVGSKVWITNGDVRAIVRDGPTLYIGGQFNLVGPLTGGAAAIDVSTGALLTGFPVVNGTVETTAPDGSGGFFLGGQFTMVGGVPRQNLAHVDMNMQVTAWNPGADGPVHALVLDNAVLYVGGGMTMLGGQLRHGLGAVDATTGATKSWYPGDVNNVFALALSGTTLYLGGNFCCVGGNARSDIAAVDINTAAVKSFNPNSNFAVFSISVVGSTVYAGGIFTTIGGQARNRIAALDATTGAATSWNPNASAAVEAVYATASAVYVGGDFTTIGGQSRNRIAAIGPADGTATSWNPNSSSTVRAIQRLGGKVYVGGDFTTIGGQSRNRIADLDATTGAASAWDPNASGTVECLVTDGFVVLAGGSFSSVNNVTRNNIAAIDLGNGAATSWNPNANNIVYTLAVLGQTVYAGGGFTSIGGQTRNRIAALSATTGLATSFNPNANNTVYTLVVRNGSTIYVGGEFTQLGPPLRNHAGALNLDGTLQPWNPNIDAAVRSLALSPDGATVYAGGNFGTVGGQSRSFLAAIGAASGTATSWNPGANAVVWSVAVRGNTVYAGGDFSTLGGQTRNGLGALDAGTALPTSWDPNAGPANVTALAVGAGTIYAAGGFNTIGGQPRTYLAALDPVTGAAKDWNADVNASGGVFVLRLDGPTLYAGGTFQTVKAHPARSLAAINASPSLLSVVPSSGGNAGPISLSVNGEGLQLGMSAALTYTPLPIPIIPAVNSIVALDGSNFEATYYLEGALPGLWGVRYYGGDGQIADLEDAFTIEAVQAPQLRVSVIGTSDVGGIPSIRRDRRTAIDVVVQNSGNVDAVSVPVWLAGVPLDATLELDFAPGYPQQLGGQPDWSTVPSFFTGPAGKYVPLVIPRVPPGTTTLRFYLTVPGPTHPPFTLIGAVAPPWMDGEVFRSCLSSGGGITDPACMGTQLDGINAYLAGNPSMPALSGIALWAKNAWICEGAATLAAAVVKSEQVLDFLEGSIESGTASPGCLNVSRPRWREALTINVVGSIDPNEKLGLQGAFSGQTVLPYSIRFENFSSATLPAQDVIVTDQLNPSVLNLSTISLDQITFGNRHIYPPPGLSSFSTTVDLRPQKNLLVNVAASLDPVTNVISWYFNSIDPATGRTPTDLTVGFLPPNVVAPEGEGSVMFTVMPQPGLATGTQISNAASILFDDPPAVTTAAWTNGVDNSPPASNVLPLAPQSHQPSINVSWTAPGSPPDLRDFTILVKQDNGPYRVWRLNTTTTSDTLVPPKDHLFHTFSFYSVARDQVGNIEAPPAVADATTQSTTDVGNETPGVLSLAGARPNPAREAVHVWFTLPSRQPATLEMLDVTGRRILKREVGSLGPGAHLVTLTPSPSPRAGLYFLRLVQGDRELKARVALIR